VPTPITFQQVQLYMKAKDLGSSQQTAAAKAGISTRTARRIASGTHRPKRGRFRDWQTRVDPLDGHWEAALLPMLEREPRLEPTTLFETLQALYPGKYDAKLRTVQRRVERWKAKHGKPKEVMFKIQHAPGADCWVRGYNRSRPATATPCAWQCGDSASALHQLSSRRRKLTPQAESLSVLPVARGLAPGCRLARALAATEKHH